MNIRVLILAALFAALTCVSAYLSIPVSVVPFTLQVLVVLTVGVIIGKRAALMSQITYVLLGLVGLPVFAGGNSGIGALSGPTGGYIISFVFAAFTVGLLVEVFEKKAKTKLVKWFYYIGAMLVGLVVIHVIGLARLSMFIGFKQAFVLYFIPYIGLDIVKVLIGSYIALLVKAPLMKANLLNMNY